MNVKMVQVFVKPEENKIWPQILTIFIVCLSTITSGAHFAWPSPFVVKLTQDEVNYSISEDEASFLVYIHSMGLVIFGVLGSKLNDSIGRKRTMLLMAIPQVSFWVITAFARSIYWFYFARVVSGFSDSLHFSSVPIYIAEISVPKVRGSWGNLVAFLIIGQFLVNLVGMHFTAWETSYIFLPLPALFAVLMFFLPESPYYSLMKGRDEEAEKALRFFRGRRDVGSEFVLIKAAVEREMSEKSRWKDMVTIKSNRKAVFAALFLRISQQFSGLAIFQTYTQYIFEGSGMQMSSSTSTLICSGLFGICSFLFSYVGEKLGRRKSYTTSMSICSIFLLSVGVYFYLSQYTDVQMTQLNWFPLAGLVGFQAVAATFGLLSMPTLMSGELFPSNIKTKAFGFQLILLGAVNVVSSVVFYELNSWLGLTAPFLFFGVCSVVSSVLSIYLVPETMGKTLAEIQESLTKNSKR